MEGRTRGGEREERGGGETIDETCFTYIFYFFLK